jgi:hypothetical protein
MVYFAFLCRRAWKDTWKVVIESAIRAVGMVCCVFVFTALYTYAILGRLEMISLLNAAGVLFLATLTVFALVFAANFFVFSPRHLYHLERAAKEKAYAELKTISDAKNIIPNIAGVWFTKFGGSVTISQDGKKIKSKFPHGSVDHFSEGQYDPQSKKMAMTTERVDIALPIDQQRYVYPETWEYLDESRILFDCPKNFNGEHEYGILYRRTYG